MTTASGSAARSRRIAYLSCAGRRRWAATGLPSRSRPVENDSGSCRALVAPAAAQHPETPPGTREGEAPRGNMGSPVLIGVPRFELGTSPTRTERATRLRHTPRRETGYPSG